MTNSVNFKDFKCRLVISSRVKYLRKFCSCSHKQREVFFVSRLQSQRLKSIEWAFYDLPPPQECNLFTIKHADQWINANIFILNATLFFFVFKTLLTLSAQTAVRFLRVSPSRAGLFAISTRNIWNYLRPNEQIHSTAIKVHFVNVQFSKQLNTDLSCFFQTFHDKFSLTWISSPLIMDECFM